MVKAKIRAHDGIPAILLLGLSDENLRRLRGGAPILFDGKPFGFDGNVCIVYGPTEAEIAAEFNLPTVN